MIFVTVGTHEQAFDRLLECVDQLKESGSIKEDVVVQTGYSNYHPVCCSWEPFFTYEEMEQYIEEAHIVITHGGPSSIFMCLERGKVPVVVPRQAKYREHVNDHQVSFCDAMIHRQMAILVAKEMDELKEIIIDYDSFARKTKGHFEHNNQQFCQSLSELIKEMDEVDHDS